MKWADSGGKEFTPAPVGNHPARCIGIIDLGTQTGEWQGKPLVRRQCVLQWELPNEQMEDGRVEIVHVQLVLLRVEPEVVTNRDAYSRLTGVQRQEPGL